MADRIDDALRWLTGEFSVTRAEFCRGLGESDSSLLEGCVSHGYVMHDRRQDRYAVSDTGRRRLADVEPAEDAA